MGNEESELTAKNETLPAENSADLQSLKDEIEALKKKLDMAERELRKYEELSNQYLDLAKRIQADFDNYKKRIQKEKDEIVKCANENLICELLSTLDDLERAISTSCSCDELKMGVNHIYNNLMSLLHSYGLREITSHDKFDPQYHEAMAIEQGEDGKILEVYQKGYLLGSKVIRHSKVKVAKNQSGGDDGAKDNWN